METGLGSSEDSWALAAVGLDSLEDSWAWAAAGLGSSEDRWAWAAADLGLSSEDRWVAAEWPEGKRVAVGVGWPDDPDKLAASVLVSWPEGHYCVVV